MLFQFVDEFERLQAQKSNLQKRVNKKVMTMFGKV
jgi:hypothetical protein